MLTNATRLFQSHLLSVFDNIRYVTFEEKMYDKIVAIISQEGENVPLQEHVMAVVIYYFAGGSGCEVL